MNILACGPINLVRGSLQKPCADCGACVWASLASLFTVTEQGEDFVIVCLTCAVRRMSGDDDVKVMQPSEAQLSEIRRELETRHP